VLFSESAPRLLNARPRQLRRATKLDWPTLIAVMHGAVTRCDEPFAAALESSRRLFSPQNVPLGVEHARAIGPMPCGLGVDMERARFIRRAVEEMQNSRGEWQPASAREDAPLGESWIFHEGKWRPALSIARTLDGIGHGQLCRLDVPNQRRYGRELILGTQREGMLLVAPWLRPLLRHRAITIAEIPALILDRLARLLESGERQRAGAAKKSAPRRTATQAAVRAAGAKFTIHSTFTRGEQAVVHLDFSPHHVAAHRDTLGRALVNPPLREAPPPCCATCPEAQWCRSVEITTTPAWMWRKLGLIESDGRPTRRGIVFSFFHHGEGLAIAAALEDATYKIADLIFDLANLRAGPRFAGDDSPFAGRLGALCAKTYDRADLEGYLTMGVPVEYGAGAAEIVREIIGHGTAIPKLQTDTLRTGDIERALIEWRSVLRHIALAPDYEWDRWRELQRAASAHIETNAPAKLPGLPPLTAAQRRSAQ
jgi:hypothetical protein